VKHYLKLLPFVAIGLVVVAIVVAWTVLAQRGARVELAGSIGKVRTLALDERSSAAIIDFRVRNPSDYLFVVRQVEVTALDSAGQPLAGMVIAQADAAKLFAYFPRVGQRYNESLLIRTKVKPGQSMDRMIAARFEVPEKVLQARRNLTIRIEELDGPVAEFSERPLR
jgi:biopolymer transport protein ExbD